MLFVTSQHGVSPQTHTPQPQLHPHSSPPPLLLRPTTNLHPNRRRVNLQNPPQPPQPLSLIRILPPTQRHNPNPKSLNPNPNPPQTQLQNRTLPPQFLQISPKSTSLTFLLQSPNRHRLQSSSIRPRLTAHRRNGSKQSPPITNHILHPHQTPHLR